MDARQFLSEFAHIASAPNGIQNLRQMIYNLAITGDLTQQVTEDADAESLLRTIESTKAGLVEKKTFKRSPKLEDQPLRIPPNINLPASWRWSRLVDIGEINPKNEAHDETLAAFIPMDGVPQLHSKKLKAEQRSWGQIKKGFTHFADGDVVLAKITPCFENGKAAVITGLTNRIGAGTTELHVVRPLQPFIDPAYIYIFLRSPYFAIEGISNMTGTAGQKRLPTEYFATKALPLPPLAEQKRIVAKVDELMALCDKLEAQQQECEALRGFTQTSILDTLANAQTAKDLISAWNRVSQHLTSLLRLPENISQFQDVIFQLGVTGKLAPNVVSNLSIEMAEDLRKLAYESDVQELRKFNTRVPVLPNFKSIAFPASPDDWLALSLESACTFIVDCAHSTPEFVEHGYYCIDTTCIQPGAILWSKVRRVSANSFAERIARLKPRRGDLLFSREGTIGTAVALMEDVDLCLGQRMMMFRFAPWVLPKFAEIYLRSRFFKQQFAPYIKGIASKHLNIEDIRKLIILVPSLSVQHSIVDTIDPLVKHCQDLDTLFTQARSTALALSVASVAAITGIKIENKEKMKTPKTELVSTLRIGVSPANRDHAPLATILLRNKGELPAKTLWNMSGLEEIDAFYQQLRTEMAKGWIVQPEVAYMREVEGS